MKDCPPDAIHRSPGGEVYITDACIGCGNCEKNRPYGVIQMAPVASGRGPQPGAGCCSGWAEPGAPRKAVKKKTADGAQVLAAGGRCDMCRNISSGPACVRACPTVRCCVSPEKFRITRGRGRRGVT